MSIYAVNGKEPVAAWIPSLDTAGNGTTTLTDLVGSNNGTLTNMDAATDWVADTGAGGVRALDFDGVDDMVVSGTSLLSGVSAFSYSVWLYQRVAASFAGVLGKYQSTSNDMELIIASSSIIQTVRTSSSAQYRQTGSIVSINAWHHVVIAFDGSQASQVDRMQVYLNGSPQSLSSNDLPTIAPVNSEPFRIGRYPGPSGSTIDGLIDDIRIFDTALNATDVAYLYNSGNGRGRVVEAATAYTFHPLQRANYHPLRYT